MTQWIAFPYGSPSYRFDRTTLLARWSHLHLGDTEPAPSDGTVLDAWTHFHAGDFARAVDAGLKAAARGQSSGMNAANKAQAIYASYLERSETMRFSLLLECARRSEALTRVDPDNANAHYLYAYALGRYAQGISVSKALSQGLGKLVLDALHTTLTLQPGHAEARIALGTYHAEVIDSVGALLGRTRGASREAGLGEFKSALRLMPESAMARIAYANGLAMLEGESRTKDVEWLYEQASQCSPQDAWEHLDVERARAELADDHTEHRPQIGTNSRITTVEARYDGQSA